MSKKSFIDAVRVKEPCTEDWNEMVGNDQVRFCTHCAKHVSNLSTMSRKEARRLVRRSGGRLCIRYIRDPRTEVPLFKEQFVQISRRAPRIAAGAMAASLSLSTLAFAQDTNPRPSLTLTLNSTQTSGTPTSSGEGVAGEPARSSDLGGLSGTVKDPAGAVVPGAAVTLTNGSDIAVYSTASNAEGVYSFESLQAGTYTLSIFSPGFSPFRQGISVSDGVRQMRDATMDVAALMGDIMVSVAEFMRPLAVAVDADDIEAVRELIANGADVNEKEDNKTTPLFAAVDNGNVEMARLLLDFGAKVNARDADKRTPLMELDDDATPELVQLLVRHGAKVNLSDNKGNTALLIAADNAGPAVVQALVDAGAEVNHVNKEGESALMNAANDDNLEKVRILLLAHADVNLKNKDDETAWDQTSDAEIENLLVSFGAKVDDEDESSDTDEPEDN